LAGNVSSPGRPGVYRAAVIGCGSIGSDIEDDVRQAPARIALPYGHAPTYRACPRTVLVAGADVDAGRRRAFAERWGLPPERVYADYHVMLERERPDVVSVAVPTPWHAEVALAAVAAGVRGVFLEKPIASSLGEAERIVGACAAAGVALAVNHQRRADPLYRQARRLIADGAIGRLQGLVAHFAGELLRTGTHAFDLLNYLSGDEPAAWLVGHLDDQPADLDPGGSAYVVYPSGVRAYVAGVSGGAVPFRLQAIGSGGEIVIGNYELALWRRNPATPRGELLRHPFPQVLPAAAPMPVLLDELLDAIEGGPPPSSCGRTAIQALALALGVHASARQGSRPLALTGVDPDLRVRSV